jgi:acetolactate synthase-1/2/3 large subunit
MLPSDALLAVDAGFGKPLTSYLWSAEEPNRYVTAHGLSTMGFALPAATALKLAYPESPVIAFMGDGSLLMRTGELTVAVEQGVAPIYVVWMDGSLAQIETKQLRQGLSPVGASVPSVSCARIAEAFGAHGCDVHTLAEFEAALSNAMVSGCPTLIGAYVDQSQRAEWFELMRG